MVELKKVGPSSRTLTIRLPLHLAEQLQMAAAKRGQSSGELLRRLVIDSLETDATALRLEAAVKVQMQAEMERMRETIAYVFNQALLRSQPN